ncbi:MAG: hypothetical protein NVV62_12930 [Terricaulis sp.]|nr:hypothetical protein [Terricaulis sp.]
MLAALDSAIPVTHTTADALALDEKARIVEHVIPMKRIVTEIIDPSKADPRSNTAFAPIADGPADSPQHLLSIFDTLTIKCWVTADEHARLNTIGRSSQWDAPDGDGWARYDSAGIRAVPLSDLRA